MKIAIFLTKFPSLSEVPVLNQMAGLIDLDYSIHLYAEQKESLPELHEDIQRLDLLTKVIYFPERPIHNHTNPFLNKLVLYLKTAPHIIKALFLNPIAVIRSLNFFKYGKFASSCWLFYNSLPFLRSHTFDIIHAQFGPNGEKAAILKDIGLFKGCKLITSFRGYDVNVIPNSDSIFRKYAFLKKHGNSFTANTNFTKQRLIRLGFDQDKLHVVHSAIQIEKFAFFKEKPTSKKIRIVSLGRLVECKGYEYAIKAVKILTTELSSHEIEYNIIGSGDIGLALQKLIERLEIKNVNLLGWMPQHEALKVLSKCDIFVHPAIIGSDGAEEAQGLVIQEAQALGLPVVASRIGGIPEGMVDGETGFLVDQKSEREIAERIAYIVKNDLIMKMGQAGRKFAIENFSQKAQTEKLIALYDH